MQAFALLLAAQFGGWLGGAGACRQQQRLCDRFESFRDLMMMQGKLDVNELYQGAIDFGESKGINNCLLYTSPSPRD